jgi:hypothetical protein
MDFTLIDHIRAGCQNPDIAGNSKNCINAKLFLSGIVKHTFALFLKPYQDIHIKPVRVMDRTPGIGDSHKDSSFLGKETGSLLPNSPEALNNHKSPENWRIFTEKKMPIISSPTPASRNDLKITYLEGVSVAGMLSRLELKSPIGFFITPENSHRLKRKVE